MGFDMHQPHRDAPARVLGAFAGIVRGETLFQIIGDAAVERAIGAFEEITDPAS